jgi:hypothetical protein
MSHNSLVFIYCGWQFIVDRPNHCKILLLTKLVSSTDIAAEKVIYYFLLYLFKFLHIKQSYLGKTLIPMSFSIKCFIMFDKAVKKYKWKMMQYYNPFLCMMSTVTGSAWYGVKVFHHSCVCNCYFAKLQGHCMKLSSCKIIDFIGCGLAFLLIICHVLVSNPHTSYPDWGFSWLSSLCEVNAGIVPEIRPKQFLSNPFQFIIHYSLYHLMLSWLNYRQCH